MGAGDRRADWLAEQYRDGANLSARVDLHRRFSTNPQGWLRWVFDRLAALQPDAILEVGCGTGEIWWENRDRLSVARQPVLSDLSPGMLSGTRARLADAMPGASWLVADAQVLPCADGAFDVVVANHMLYHVPDRPRALAEFRRVLRPGGWLLAATNGLAHLRELDELLWGVAPEAAQDDIAPFKLENGAAQLRPWFAEVRREDYDDALAITAVEPVVAYILSTRHRRHLDDARIARLRQAVAETIARDGAFHVTKATGLFTCRAPA